MKKSRAIILLLTVGLVGWTSRVWAQPPPSPAPALVAQGQTNTAPAENHQAYVLSTNGTLFLTLPAGWTGMVKEARGTGGLHDAIIFTPADTNELKFMIVIFSMTKKHAGEAELKNSLLQTGERELKNCVETSLTIEDLKGGRVEGAYYRVTDRRLATTTGAAGDFKYMTRGYAVLEPLVMTFELVSNDADRDEPAALEAIKSARFAK